MSWIAIQAFLKRFWQPIATLGAIIFALLFKKSYDKKVAEAAEERLKRALDHASSEREKKFVKKSERTANALRANDIPESWAELELLSKKAASRSRKPKKN